MRSAPLTGGVGCVCAGMVTSNEPGYYEDGRYGIRIESVVICNEAPTPHHFAGVKWVVPKGVLRRKR
jgi:Xaa-Pro aminopeptidase